MDGEGEDGAPARRPGAGPHGPDLDLDAQIADLAAELQFDETEAIEGLDGLDDIDDIDDVDDDIEELDADIEELADALPDVPEPRRLYLRIDGRVHVVEKDRFVIGRVSGQSDLAIIDANVSRQHCAIERRDGEFYVKDLGSTNGIEVHGLRVDDHRIREGEVLVLSGHEIHCSFTAPIVEVSEPRGLEPDFARADAPALTGEFPPIPSDAAPEPEPQPQPEPEPEPEPQPEPEPEEAEWPEMYEERMELRLHLLATEVAELRGMVRELVASLDALKVDALASLIQNRLQKARRP